MCLVPRVVRCMFYLICDMYMYMCMCTDMCMYMCMYVCSERGACTHTTEQELNITEQYLRTMRGQNMPTPTPYECTPYKCRVRAGTSLGTYIHAHVHAHPSMCVHL